MLKQLIKYLPAAWVQFGKRVYYPVVLKQFNVSSWPGGDMVSKLVKPGDHVIDVGANIGYVSMLLAQWVGPEGHVLSCEPMPETFRLLKSNMRALRQHHVSCHPVALSDHEGRVWMTVPTYASGHKNYYEAAVTDVKSAPQARGTWVRCSRLDHMSEGLRGVSFIKIDAEGHEDRVLAGTMELIRRDKPALYVEISLNPKTADGRQRVFKELKQAGYDCYQQVDGKLILAEIAADGDYFFLQPEQRENID